ncbi:MAG: hypothetical protein C0594_11295 [Marinilabiliales bacterium]|nr:MAG: hypothetical protein C0594_11295 [Marinilabiliales bacterium]
MVHFSIIIPTYNRADFLDKAIQSVLNQSYPNWELLVVDDGSTDSTQKLIRSYKHNKIKYIYQNNAERSTARNNGILMANGKYICFLDSDDQYLPNHLELLHKEIIINNHPVGLFHTGAIKNDTVNKRIVKEVFYSKDKFEHPVNYVWKELFNSNTVCIEKSILKKHNYPQQYFLWEDAHLFIRILLEYPLFQIHEHTVEQLFHKGSTFISAFERISLQKTDHYLSCIQDVFTVCGNKLTKHISLKDKENNTIRILDTFTYHARRNCQYGIALALSARLIRNKALSLGLRHFVSTIYVAVVRLFVRDFRK